MQTEPRLPLPLRNHHQEEEALKATIVGLGRVGTVVSAGLASAGHEVLGVDIDHCRVTALQRGSPPFHEPKLVERLSFASRRSAIRFLHRDEVMEDLGDVAVVAVDTPSEPESAPDLRQVRNAVSWIKSTKPRNLVIAMKSTVPPGTGLELAATELLGTGIGYVANPEFLREGWAIRDWDSPDRIVIGTASDARWSAERVKRMYSGVDAPFLVTDVASAEMVKYASNAFLATRISFINEIAALCDSFGASIEAVSEGLAMDSRTGVRVHAGIGFGGSCLPKDVRALDLLARTAGVDVGLLRAVASVNSRQRLLPLRALLERFSGRLDGLRIGVLGMAFKPGTEDIRDAPALELIRVLAVEGAAVTIFDPEAGKPGQGQLPSSTRLVAGVEEAAEGAQALCLCTEWDQIVSADWPTVARRMASPRFVFDGRNALDPGEMRRLGFEYRGIGRNSISVSGLTARTHQINGSGAVIGGQDDC